MPRSRPVARQLLLAGLSGLLLSSSLSACSGFKQALGIEPTSPDEFQVVARAPLSLPPDYSLRPPRPGAHRPQDTAPTDQARETVFGGGAAAPKPAIAAAPNGRSPGEAALLKEAGANSGDPAIRQLVTRENTRNKEAEQGFADSLLFWQKPAEPNETIDPTEESRRLQQKAADASASTDKPTIVRRSTTSEPGGSGSFLGGLFKGIF